MTDLRVCLDCGTTHVPLSRLGAFFLACCLIVAGVLVPVIASAFGWLAGGAAWGIAALVAWVVGPILVIAGIVYGVLALVARPKCTACGSRHTAPMDTPAAKALLAEQGKRDQERRRSALRVDRSQRASFAGLSPEEREAARRVEQDDAARFAAGR